MRVGGFHCQKRHDLQQVVLYDITDGARFLVKLAASLHTKRFGHVDLHAVYVVAIPDRLQEGVGEPEEQKVLDCVFAQIVINAKDSRLWESLMQRLVEFDAEGRSRPNGFSTITRALAAQPACARPSTTVSNMLGGIAR